MTPYSTYRTLGMTPYRTYKREDTVPYGTYPRDGSVAATGPASDGGLVEILLQHRRRLLGVNTLEIRQGHLEQLFLQE